MVIVQTGIRGGGEMGERIRAFNWHNTMLGGMEDWPQSLITTISNMVHCRFPMFLWWGPELICFYNDAYRPSLGRDGKHPFILGQPAKEAWAEIWHVIKPLIDDVLAGGESTWRENQLIPIFRNGSMEDVYWTFSYSPVFDESVQRAGVLVTCTETTDQVIHLQQLKESKRHLMESERRFRNLVMKAPVAMAVFEGADFVTKIANPSVLEYWGRTHDLVLNKPLFDALPEAAGQGFEELLTGVLHSGTRVEAKESPVRLFRNGHMEDTFVNFVYERFHDHLASKDQIIVVAIEVTDLVKSRKKLEQSEEELSEKVKNRTLELNMANEALLVSNSEWKKSNADLQQFAYAASHDLKEPIRKIQFYASLLKEDPATFTAEQINYFDKMIRATSRMASLIDNILAFSQVGGALDNIEIISLHQVIDQVKEDLEMLINEKKALIQYSELPSIQVNSYQIHQVFQNLITNALKFQVADSKPVIRISSKYIKGIDGPFKLSSADLQTDFCLIEITDNGIGFDPVNADKIFKLFTRLEERTTYPGTGIGLSIVKKIIENHHGYIRAISEPGVGSTFQILLPANSK